MIFLAVVLLFFLSSLAQCTKLSNPLAAQILRNSLSPDRLEIVNGVEFLIFDKFNGNDIRKILDHVNDIKRKVAYEAKFSNAALLNYDENLEKVAENVTCGEKFVDPLNYVVLFSNDVRVLREGIQNFGTPLQNNLNWFVALLSPQWHSIGCVPKECDVGGRHYEMTCVMQATDDSFFPKDGSPGTGCKYGWNDGGLCNNDAASIWSAFLALIILLITL